MKLPPVDQLVFQCQAVGLPEPVRELKFHPTRRWRFDLSWETTKGWKDEAGRYVWAPYKLAVEVDGGAFLAQGGRHTRGAGYRADCEKLAEAVILGWRVMRILPEHVTNGKAIQWLEKLLK